MQGVSVLSVPFTKPSVPFQLLEMAAVLPTELYQSALPVAFTVSMPKASAAASRLPLLAALAGSRPEAPVASVWYFVLSIGDLSPRLLTRQEGSSESYWKST